MITEPDDIVGDADQQNLLRHLCKFVVGMCGTYIHLDEKGNPAGGPTLYS